jgi:hypothetical protein
MLQVLQVMHVLPAMLRSRAAVGFGHSSSTWMIVKTN